MVFYLANGRVNGVRVSVLVVIGDFLIVFMINADRMAVERIRFLDDPAMFGTLGLDFVEIICFADEFEIRRGEQDVFLWGKHHCSFLCLLVLYFGGASQTIAGCCGTGEIRIQFSS